MPHPERPKNRSFDDGGKHDEKILSLLLICLCVVFSTILVACDDKTQELPAAPADSQTAGNQNAGNQSDGTQSAGDPAENPGTSGGDGKESDPGEVSRRDWTKELSFAEKTNFTVEDSYPLSGIQVTERLEVVGNDYYYNSGLLGDLYGTLALAAGETMTDALEEFMPKTALMREVAGQFGAFTYDAAAGVYKAAELFCEDEALPEKLYSCEVRFQDGVLVYVQADWSAPANSDNPRKVRFEMGSAVITPPETPVVGSSVTEEQFRAAITLDGVTSVSVTTQGNTIEVDGNKSLVTVDGAETIHVYWDVQETFAYVYSPYEQQYVRMRVLPDHPLYRGAVSMNRLAETLYLTEFVYSDFTYADGCYTASMSVEGEQVTTELRFDKNGRLYSVRQIFGGGFAEFSDVLFTEYNNVTVELPATFIDGGDMPSGSGDDTWAQYFPLTMLTVDASVTGDKTMTYQVKFANGAAWFHAQNYVYNGVTYPDFTAYSDAENVYINGTLDPELDLTLDQFAGDFDFSFCRQAFQEVSEGVYVCDEYTLLDVITYKNVQITMDGDHISRITYSVTYDNGDGTIVTLHYEAVFSNWGTTEIERGV